MPKQTLINYNPFMENPFIIGFDPLFDDLITFHNSLLGKPNYPPYDIIETGGNGYLIDVALAGFSKSDLDITVQNNMLVIKTKDTNKEPSETDSNRYIKKGIGKRAFTLEFKLNEHIKVLSAKMDNGILSVLLQKQVPEELKPKTIEIE